MIDKQFPAGVPVMGDNLIGRGKEIKAILSTLLNGQSVILTAPRRLGKTSLALEVLKKMRGMDHFVADIDLFKIISKREFAEKIVDATLENKKISNFAGKLKKGLGFVLKNIQLKQVVENFEFVLDLGSSTADENKLLENSLEFLEKFSAKYNKHIFVFLDEFGDITKLGGDDVLKKMRAIIQRQQNVTYLFAGSQESVMKHLFGDRKSPFFRFAMSYEIGNLPLPDTTIYIKKKFTSLGFEISDTVVNEIVNRSEGHPYYTQLLCQKIYLDIKDDKKIVDAEDVRNGLFSSITSERQYFDELWQRLRERKNHILVAKSIAEAKSPYELVGLDKQLVYNILVILEKSGMVKKCGKAKYEMVDPFFRKYILSEDLENSSN